MFLVVLGFEAMFTSASSEIRGNCPLICDKKRSRDETRV